MSASLRRVDVDVSIEHETKFAWLVDDGDSQVWIPKSMASITAEHAQGWVTLNVDRRIAQEKGLI